MVAGRTSALRIALCEPGSRDQRVLVVVRREHMVSTLELAGLRHLIRGILELLNRLIRVVFGLLTVLCSLLRGLCPPQSEARLDLAE